MNTLELTLAVAGVVLALVLYAWLLSIAGRRRLAKELKSSVASSEDLAKRLADSTSALDKARQDLDRVAPYLAIPSAHAEVQRLRTEADSYDQQVRAGARQVVEGARSDAVRLVDQAKAEAAEIVKEARSKASESLAASAQQVDAATEQARRIVEQAEKRSEEVAGEAYLALKESKHLEQVVEALHNKIEGYGDRYVVPSFSILDELAEAYGFAEAGRELKSARQRSSRMIDEGSAALCDYVEQNRRVTAIRFVLDAFNGKVDSVLSGTRSENVGTLTQRIQDAFALVNFNGQAFRNARITSEYLAARLDELRWASAAVALREHDREEQRIIKARIREEQRAQREFERAKREAERDEAAARKAMARMEVMLAQATEEQKQKYQAQLDELNIRLAAAEAKGQRALSMAQQTKSGHVYIISNIGSFGENVYKIGMTRRLEPLDRIRELGDASVPFGFDVHALLYAEDAPAVERVLHRQFLLHQINKVNPRKEFFRVQLSDLKREMDTMGLSCSWTLAAEAAEYKETMVINAQIAANDAAREIWLRQQAVMDPVTEGADTDEESEAELETA